MENLQVFQFLNFFNRDTTQLEQELSKNVYVKDADFGWVSPDVKHKTKLSFLQNDFLVLCMKSKYIESCKPVYIFFDLKDKWLLITSTSRENSRKVIDYVRSTLFFRLKVMLPDTISAEKLVEKYQSGLVSQGNLRVVDIDLSNTGHKKAVYLQWNNQIKFTFTSQYSLLNISNGELHLGDGLFKITKKLRTNFGRLLNELFYYTH